MKKVIALSFALSTALSASGALAESVIVSACPKRGIEPKCIMLTDKNGKTYDVSALKGDPFKRSLVIALKGETTTDVGPCLSISTVLKKISWQYTRMQCPK